MVPKAGFLKSGRSEVEHPRIRSINSEITVTFWQCFVEAFREIERRSG